eukprot:1743065-Pyramimonas_sp.AAC.1
MDRKGRTPASLGAHKERCGCIRRRVCIQDLTQIDAGYRQQQPVGFPGAEPHAPARSSAAARGVTPSTPPAVVLRYIQYMQ